MQLVFDFSQWLISPRQGVVGRQYDNLSHSLVVEGELPSGYTWDVLVEAKGKYNIIPLSATATGATASLTADQLAFGNTYYAFQLRGTSGEIIHHTNAVQVYVPDTIVGPGTWPVLPTEFSKAEANIKELNAHPPVPGENGYWMLWDLDTHSYVQSQLVVPGLHIEIGETTTGKPGTPASVTNSGTNTAPVLNFTIPEGEKGDAATIQVGTVTASEPGSEPKVKNSGTENAAVFDFVLQRGQTGPTGQAATIEVESTATGEPGTQASVENVGTTGAVKLRFTIPRGNTGQNGATPTLAAGNVETLEPGQPATASVTGEGPAYQINLGIPQGKTGETGVQGVQGEIGPRGYTFTPAVDDAGNLSWTNDGGLPNPEEVNIKGPIGATGPQGNPGATPTIAVGTVTTLDPGQDATAEITGETPNLVLSLGIPQGQPGKDGTEWTEQELLEKNISDYYAMRRTGKVYQTRFWKFAANPTSAGEKLLDNAGLVFEPSTDTEEGHDDYLNGQNPMFEWVNVNYIRDDDGAPRPTAIEGQENYKTSGAVDVGAMQMSFWYKIDSSDEEYIYYIVSDTPHPELGLVPWPECVKADGTVLPWCIASKYFSGTASDGLQRSQPGMNPTRNISYNSMITTYQNKGPGYWGAGAVRNTFQILFNAIKGATKSSQTLFAGTTNWSFQYSASVQRSEKDTYFPVTNSQANNLVVGTYVSVGYGSNNNGTVNQDRGVATMHAYADDVKILRIEDLDESNKAVYLDVEESFDTMPVQLTDELSANITMSSMHWWSGATDSVLGHHDGSPTSNANGRFPYRVQGREYSVGGYAVASDTVAWLNEDGTRTVYSAPRGAEHVSANDSIKETYKESGTIPVHSGGAAADYWVGDCVVDPETGAWHPDAQGSGSTQGCGDMYYAGGTSANTFREFLQGGYLGNGSGAGSCYLHLGAWLGNGDWYCLAGD